MWSNILVDFGFVFTLRQRHNFEHFYNMLTSDDFYDY
jgi:hypothetical protein